MVTKEEAIANKIIREMREAGLSYGQMLQVIRLAKEKFDRLKKVNRKMNNQWNDLRHEQRTEAIRFTEQGKIYLQTMNKKRIDGKTEILIRT